MKISKNKLHKLVGREVRQLIEMMDPTAGGPATTSYDDYGSHPDDPGAPIGEEEDLLHEIARAAEQGDQAKAEALVTQLVDLSSDKYTNEPDTPMDEETLLEFRQFLRLKAKQKQQRQLKKRRQKRRTRR